MMMQLTGTLVQLRALEPNDLDRLYKWENDTTVWSVSGTMTPFSRFVLEEYLASAHNDIYTNKQLRLMIDVVIPNEHSEDEEEIFETRSIGLIDLFDFDPLHRRAGVGILVADKADRGKGYASESLRLLIDYGFEVLNLHQLYTNIVNGNESSMQLFKKHGFEVTGLKQDWIIEHGKFTDEYTLQLIRK